MSIESQAPHAPGASAMAAHTVHADTDGYLQDPRLCCCLEAAAELAALLKLVQACMRQAENSMLKMQTRAMLARATRLCNILQDGLGDDTVSTEQMAAVLNLELE